MQRSKSKSHASDLVFKIRRFRPVDLGRVTNVIREVYPPKPRRWALATFRYHVRHQQAGIADGRTFFLVETNGNIVGVFGTHTHIWGPPDIAWASWFFVAKRFHRSRYALRVAELFFARLQSSHIRRLYVETYSAHPDYSLIAGILPKIGFVLEARLLNYVQSGVDMLYFAKDISRL